MIQSVRGMHDILPDEIKYWQYIYNTAFKILDTANYQEIRTPIVESQSLFLRSIGENTDIVGKEIYTLIDRGQRELALRPEGTASIARAILEHKLCDQGKTQKLWYLGPMFRYERPQQGRQRQFHQLGIECYGSQSPVLDAEVIYLAYRILDQLNCPSLCIELNSIGNNAERTRYENSLREYLQMYINDLDPETIQKINSNTLRILDSKNLHIQNILSEAPNLEDHLQIESKKHFEDVQQYLQDLNIKFTLNSKLVRGLDYYNNTVFEIKTQELGAQDTVCGGGRYDNLTKQLGGNAIHAMGWGIGIERLLLLVQNQVSVSSTKICFYIATQRHEYVTYALNLLPIIHKNSLKYELDISGRSLKKQMQKANKQDAMICIILGAEEIAQEKITLKWLDTHKQKTCSIEGFMELIPEIIKDYNHLQSSKILELKT
uniref:Histidine--tRNA ligase, chloroplastic n=1 Tax=Helminthocladia australis TaxID=260093 RepID=A0A1G4NU26_9FLOR|nr:Histidine-tRNA ligase [Helminthocladia australis]SCW22056.1 Histidine-tRNA ligase [Helminthocladia australis]